MGYLTREQADALMEQGRAVAAEQQRQQEAAARAEAERQREAAVRADDAAYAAAEAQNSVEGYEEYLRDYPTGRHIAEAQMARARLREAEEARRKEEGERRRAAAEAEARKREDCEELRQCISEYREFWCEENRYDCDRNRWPPSEIDDLLPRGIENFGHNQACRNRLGEGGRPKYEIPGCEIFDRCQRLAEGIYFDLTSGDFNEVHRRFCR